MTFHNDGPSVPRSIHRERILSALSTADYFVVNRRFYKSGLMGKIEAIFLQDLINLSTIPSIVKDPSGYFLCTVSFLEAAGWTRDEQEVYTKKLEVRGIIRKKRSGLPPVRWMWIDIEKVIEVLDSAYTPHVNQSPASAGDKSPASPQQEGLGITYPTPKKTKNCRLRDRGVEEPMCFIEELSKKDESVTPFDIMCARKLYDGIVKSGKIQLRCNFSKWAKEFAVLREFMLQDDTDRLETVLDWYIPRIGGVWVKQAFCGSSFKKKFFDIETSMKRDQILNPSVDVSDRALQMFEIFKGKHWPKGTKDQLPATIQLTMDRYRIWTTNLERVRGKDLSPPLRRFLEHLLSGRLPNFINFTEVWITDLNKRLQNWTDWSGKLITMAFNHQSQEFRNMGRGWAAAYCDKPDMWDRLVEVM